MEIWFLYHLDSNTVIATKFCTWHDSCAVVACAKICCDLMASNGIIARRSFHRIWITGKKSLVKRAPGDVINDVMNVHLYNCSHNVMIHMHKKFDDDIFARCLVIMNNVVILFIKEYRGTTLRPPCDVIYGVIIMKILFWHNLGRSFHIWGQIEAVFTI